MSDTSSTIILVRIWPVRDYTSKKVRVSNLSTLHMEHDRKMESRTEFLYAMQKSMCYADLWDFFSFFEKLPMDCSIKYCDIA